MPPFPSLVERFRRATRLLPASLVPFVLVGFTGLGVHTAVFSVCFHARWLDKREAWLAGLVVATLVTWTLNRTLTFKASGRNSGWEIVRYAIVTLVSQGVSYAVFMGASGLLPQVPPQLALFTGAVVATAFSYTGQRFFTFAPYKPTTPVAVGDTPVLVAAGSDGSL